MFSVILRDMISPYGKFNRFKFLVAEFERGCLLFICYLFFSFHLKLIAATLLPFAVWIGIVATIKRFNDLNINPTYILLALTIISAGAGIGWQLNNWLLSLSGLIPYLLWITLSPGKSN